MTNPHFAQPSRAVILLSGGLDSATALAIARQSGHECYCLSLEYGQRHHTELEAAKRAGYDKAITFEFSHFMSPQSAYLQAGHLYDRYKEYFKITPCKSIKKE